MALGRAQFFINVGQGGRESVSTCPVSSMLVKEVERACPRVLFFGFGPGAILYSVVGRLASPRYCIFTQWYLLMFLTWLSL